jgi:hypothetical protein
MRKILSGFIVMLLFCLVTSVAYLRIPPKPPPQTGRFFKERTAPKIFAGQRHSGIDVTEKAQSDLGLPTIAQTGPIPPDPGSR